MRAPGFLYSLFFSKPLNLLKGGGGGLARASGDGDGVGTPGVVCASTSSCTRARTRSSFSLIFFFIKLIRPRIPTKWACGQSEALKFEVKGWGDQPPAGA